MKKIFWAMLAMAALATACQKDPDEIACPEPGPATFDGLTKRHSPPVQVFEFDPTTYQQIRLASGGHLWIEPNIFIRPDGSQPTGRIKLLFQEIYSPAEMILANRPTMGTYRTQLASFVRPLESGGEFNIRVMEGNMRLRLTPQGQNYGLRMNTPVPARVSQLRVIMSLWAPWPSTNTDSLIWKQVQLLPDSLSTIIRIPIQTDTIFGSQLTTVTGFSTTQWPDTLGWLNCDVFPFTVTTTKVSVSMSDLQANPATEGFRIYLIPAQLNGAFRPVWNPTTRQADQTNIPVGTDLTAVVLRIKDNKYFLGTQRAIVTDGFVFQPELEEVTEDELVRRLQQL